MGLELVSRYLDLFKKLEDFLYKIVDTKDRISFSLLVDKVSEKDSFVKRTILEIKELSYLRNLLSHGKIPLAYPAEEAVKKLEYIYASLTSPPSVLKIATPNVHSCKVSEKISDVIKVMKDKLYTHVPVYNKEEFVGLLTESAVTYWVAAHVEEKGEGFIITENTVGEMEEFIKNDTNNEYIFVNRNKSAYEIEGMFYDYIEQGRRLGAVFVTENGKENEKPLGIITAWDMPKLKKFRDKFE